VLFHRPARLADGLGPESGPGPTDPCAPATPFRRRGVGFPAPRRQPGIRLQQPVHCPRQVPSASSRRTPCPAGTRTTQSGQESRMSPWPLAVGTAILVLSAQGCQACFFSRGLFWHTSLSGPHKPSAFSRRPLSQKGSDEATEPHSHEGRNREQRSDGATQRCGGWPASVVKERSRVSCRHCEYCAAGASMGSRAARLSELGGDWWLERGIASRNLSGPATAVLPRKDRGTRGGGEGWRNLGTPYRFPDLQPRLQASERPGAPTPAQPAPRRDLTARQTCVRG
jgi:hypothetical protein